MFCHKCGAQIAEGAAFCQKCGAKVLPAEGESRPIPQAADEQGRAGSKETTKQPPAAPTKAGTTPNLLGVLVRIGAIALPLLAVYALIAAVVGFSVNRVFAAILLILGFLGAVSKALSGLFRKSKVLAYGLLGLAAILAIVVLGALMSASQSEDTSSNTSPNNSNPVSSDGRIVLGDTQYFDDISFGNMEVTLDYVQFTDRLQDAWTGNYIYPDENFVFLWAAFILENIGTTNSTLPTAWSTIVYDDTYEFTYHNADGNLDGIPPLTASTEGVIIFMVPTAVMESDKSLVLNIGGFADGTVLSYTIRPGDKLLEDLSDVALGTENDPPASDESTVSPSAGAETSMDGLLFNGTLVYDWLGASIETIENEWGFASNFTEEGDMSYYNYAGVGFAVDDNGIIRGITIYPGECTLNGISLDKSRSELIEILGTPASEGYYDDPDSFDTYYMLYDNVYGDNNLIIDLYDDMATWLYIGNYEV